MTAEPLQFVPVDSDRLLGVEEVAHWLNMSPACVRQHANGLRRPQIPSVKLGKCVRRPGNYAITLSGQGGPIRQGQPAATPFHGTLTFQQVQISGARRFLNSPAVDNGFRDEVFYDGWTASAGDATLQPRAATGTTAARRKSPLIAETVLSTWALHNRVLALGASELPRGEGQDRSDDEDEEG
jgi:hypothetical protein